MKFLTRLRPRRLNMSGVSHIMVPMVVIVGFAVVGTYALVASHAATPTFMCSTSAAHVVYSNDKLGTMAAYETITFTNNGTKATTPTEVALAYVSNINLKAVAGPNTLLTTHKVPAVAAHSKSAPITLAIQYYYNVVPTHPGSITIRSYSGRMTCTPSPTTLYVKASQVAPTPTKPSGGTTSHSTGGGTGSTGSTGTGSAGGSVGGNTGTTSSSEPSGQAPPGTITGYTNVCTEDFAKTAATGSWGTSDSSAVVYQSGCKWTEYPDGWPSTYTGGAVGYAPAQVLSVHDGELDFYLHPVNGHAAGANPSPILSSGSQYQAYGKYIVRMKTDAVSGYHDAFLLWPQNDSNWQYAETDFPEMDLTDSSVTAFAHYGGGGSQDAFSYNVNLTGWHTYEQDWAPGTRSFYVDGKLIGTTTKQVFSSPERYQLQTEPSSTAAGGTGHQLIDWVAVYSKP